MSRIAKFSDYATQDMAFSIYRKLESIHLVPLTKMLAAYDDYQVALSKGGQVNKLWDSAEMKPIVDMYAAIKAEQPNLTQETAVKKTISGLFRDTNDALLGRSEKIAFANDVAAVGLIATDNFVVLIALGVGELIAAAARACSPTPTSAVKNQPINPAVRQDLLIYDAEVMPDNTVARGYNRTTYRPALRTASLNMHAGLRSALRQFKRNAPQLAA